MLKQNVVAGQAYRDAMSRFAGAVHVVTTDGHLGVVTTEVHLADLDIRRPMGMVVW